jgi:hypothetical protein
VANAVVADFSVVAGVAAHAQLGAAGVGVLAAAYVDLVFTTIAVLVALGVTPTGPVGLATTKGVSLCRLAAADAVGFA